MGLRFRKSINLGGGFRINLSKSGIGYSWGVKGYRITKTAKGTTRRTVSIPGTGISYVTSSGGKRMKPRSSSGSIGNTPVATQLEYVDASNQVVHDVTQVKTANAENMRPAEYSDLFKAVKKLTIIATLLMIFTLISLFTVPVLALAFAIAFFVFILTNNIQLDYEFDEYAKEKWAIEEAAWKGLATCKKIWYAAATASLKGKTNAGADQGALLSEAKIAKKLPWPLKSDLNPLIITIEKQKYIFMPDRILILNGAKLGAVAYKDINFTFGIQPFGGDIHAPSETEIMEYRWLKVNKNGTPDKRYKGNKQIPVYKLGAINMKTDTGLQIMLMTSRVNAVEKVEAAYSKQ